MAGLALLALLVVAAFPVGPFKGIVEERLSARFGRAVTIASIERAEAVSFTPTIVVRGVRVPQAAWAGPGDLARVGEIRMRLRAIDVLRGRFSPSAVAAAGVRLDLVRDTVGRKNWTTDDDRDTAAGGAPRIAGFTVSDTIIRYRDAKRGRTFTVQLAADARGVRLSGMGEVRGNPVRVQASGPAITRSGQSWPFEAAIEGAALTMRATGRMDSPLDTDRMTLKLNARAADLKLIDAIVEAGLFGTQPVALTADVRHDEPDWVVTNLRGTIGTSDIAGRLTVKKRDGRTRLAGDIRSQRLDFDDLATDAGTAAALALERSQGLRLVPNTRINIAKIDTTDGRIAFRVDTIVSTRRPSSLTSTRGVLTIERQLLTVEPLRIAMRQGVITGKVTVDQRGDAREPIVTLALDLTGSSIAAIAGGGDVTGRLDARVRLTGRGSTIREAVGRSDGSIGVVAKDGALPAKMAALLGFDAGRALTADDDARATLRCAIVRLAMRGGRGTFAPLIVDTSVSQTRGAGAIAFPGESIAATLTGAPKRDSVLRLPGSVLVSGTIRDPQVIVPKEVKSVGNILKGAGRAITGRQGPTAADADCSDLSRRAIGR